MRKNTFFGRRSPSLPAIIILSAVVLSSGILLIKIQSERNHQVSGVGIRDVHHWNDHPVEVKDLDLAKGLFDMSEGYVKAWDIGTYRDGYGIQSQLNGARILLVAFRSEMYDGEQGPFGTKPNGACDSLARIFIFKALSGNSFVAYDERYSPNNILRQGFHFISKDGDPINANAQFYYTLAANAVIPSLDFPGFVVHDGQTFVRQLDSFPCHVIDEQGKTQMFFEDIKDSLKPAGFTDPMLGTAYADKSQDGIIFRASDGTYVRYRSW